MMKRLVLGLAAAAILAIATLPAGAEQTFWTIDTGSIPSPYPTATYPVYLEYYLYNTVPYSCAGRRHGHCTRPRLAPTVAPMPIGMPGFPAPTAAPLRNVPPLYRTPPFPRHT
jgi:hypothetical protein